MVKVAHQIDVKKKECKEDIKNVIFKINTFTHCYFNYTIIPFKIIKKIYSL